LVGDEQAAIMYTVYQLNFTETEKGAKLCKMGIYEIERCNVLGTKFTLFLSFLD
jgi:hypothetical protein